MVEEVPARFKEMIANEIGNALRAKNPSAALERIELRPTGHSEYVAQEVATAQRTYNKTANKPRGKQGIEIICQGLSPQEPYLVFQTEELAQRAGVDCKKVEVRGEPYWIAENSIYQPGRTLAELMYAALYQPSTFNNPFIHGEGRQFTYIKIRKGGFISSQGLSDTMALPNMPTIDEMIFPLREKELFPKERIRQNDVTTMLNGVLAGRISDPDKEIQGLFY